MPGPSFSISAALCQTGSALRKIPGTPCSKCYALKGRYTFPNVQQALDIRLKGWLEDKDWVLLMSIRLLYISDTHEYFRFFDSGDLQSLQMLQDINQVAWNVNPHVKIWLPTQERKYVNAAVDIAPNLTIRVSSTKVNEVQTASSPNVQNSLVSTGEVFFGHKCPSKEQDNKCGLCRACWSKTISHVTYIQH
jgi:hypothetical protein